MGLKEKASKVAVKAKKKTTIDQPKPNKGFKVSDIDFSQRQEFNSLAQLRKVVEHLGENFIAGGRIILLEEGFYVGTIDGFETNQSSGRNNVANTDKTYALAKCTVNSTYDLEASEGLKGRQGLRVISADYDPDPLEKTEEVTFFMSQSMINAGLFDTGSEVIIEVRTDKEGRKNANFLQAGAVSE